MKLLYLYLACITLAFSEEPILTSLSQKGLPAKITIRVRDQDGKVVPNALVVFSFGVSSQKTSNVVKTNTNSNGLATGEARVNQKIAITVSKDNYYSSFYSYSVWRGCGGYESGRWEPWNPTVEATIFIKKNPRFDNYYPVSSYTIEPNKEYGFDLFQRKIVSVDNGDYNFDFKICVNGSYYSTKILREDDWTAKDCISFCNEGDGLMTKQRNGNSCFVFQYLAPVDAYEPCIEYEFSKIDGKISISRGYPSDNKQYLVFRISRISDKGEIQYYYGIITVLNFSKNWITGTVNFRIQYRLNPEPGDRNIEYN